MNAKLNRLHATTRAARWIAQVLLAGSITALAAVESGCGDVEEVREAAPGGSPAAATPSETKQIGLSSENDARALTTSASATQSADKGKAPAVVPATPRKIIYDARIELLVDSFAATEQALLDLIKENEGFVAESDQASLQSTRRHATWRVRLPVDRFDSFISAVGRLGEVRQQHVGSQDVTEEYVDIEARIRNKQEEEKRLLKHLNDSTGKLDEILLVERELSRVRGEVEQMQGRIRYLANRSALSTITIDVTEWKDYKPPVAASFPTQLGRTFSSSVDGVIEFGKGLALVVVAVVPWVPVIVVALAIVFGVLRLNRGKARRSPIKVAPVSVAPG